MERDDRPDRKGAQGHSQQNERKTSYKEKKSVETGRAPYLEKGPVVLKPAEESRRSPLIPTEKGVSLLVDCGANVDARPSHLVQFAKMGSIYMEHVMGIKNPTVGIGTF